MKAMPQIVPVSDLRNDYNRVLVLADQGPVFLTRNGHAAGVLVSTTAWDRLFAKLEDLQDIVDVQEAELAIARGEEVFAPVHEAELLALVALNEVPA